MATKFFMPTQLLRGAAGICFLMAMAVQVASGGQKQAPQPIPMDLVMQTIREYGHENQPAAAANRTANAVPATGASDIPSEIDGAYQAYIMAAFANAYFAKLEKEARQVRISKARLKGGAWKLFALYEGSTTPIAGNRATDSDWNAHLAAINKWIAAYPDSATPRIALADSYVNYAWAARGQGYANTVSESGWSLFEQRIELGKAALLEAAHVKERCPYWYEAMQRVALAQGWEKRQARELLDQAAAFEPSYYHFYREYANFLLPKWYGEDGETQAFAEEVSKHLGDPDGQIVYFEIASLLACQCQTERDTLTGMSWPRVKQGYVELQRLYSTSNLKMNRFAYMSFVAGDKSSARDSFSQLGDSWNGLVWRSAQNFASAKEWSATP